MLQPPYKQYLTFYILHSVYYN